MATPAAEQKSNRFTKWLRKESSNVSNASSNSANTTSSSSSSSSSSTPKAKCTKVAAKTALKSVVCTVYECVFEGRPVEGNFSSWDDFWLLRADCSHIMQCTSLLSEAELLAEPVNSSLSSFLQQSKSVACNASNLPLRRLRALETTAAILRGILSKREFKSYAIDVMRATCGPHDQSAFYGELIRACAIILEKDTPTVTQGSAHAKGLKLAASETLKSIVCSQEDTSINCLLEYPVSILQQSSVFATVFTQYNRAASPAGYTAVPSRERHPERYELNVLTIFSVLISHARENRIGGIGDGKRNVVSVFLGEKGGAALEGLIGLMECALHCFNKGQILYSSRSMSGSVSMSSSGMFSGWLSYMGWGAAESADQACTGSGDRYYELQRLSCEAQTDLQMFPEFHPQNPRYNPIPSLLSCTLLIISELASPTAPVEEFMEIFLNSKVDTAKQFEHLRDGGGVGVNDSFAHLEQTHNKQTSSYLWLELVLASSIVLHMSKHPHVLIATGGVLIAWCNLVRQGRVSTALFENTAKSHFFVTGRAMGGKWLLHASTGSENSTAGTISSVLLSVVDSFVSTHLPSLYAIEHYELAVDLLVHLVVCQVEAKQAISFDWSHLFEKILQVVKATTKYSLVESAMARNLLKKCYHLMKLLLKKPTVLTSQDALSGLVYDLVRYKDVFTAVKENFGVYVKEKGLSSSMKGLRVFLDEALKLIDKVETNVELHPSTPAAHLVTQIVDESDSNQHHDLLWQLPPSLYEEISCVTREVDTRPQVSRLMCSILCEAAYLL